MSRIFSTFSVIFLVVSFVGLSAQAAPKIFNLNLPIEKINALHLQLDQMISQNVDQQTSAPFQIVNCPDPERCHPSVGMMLSIGSEGIGQCTVSVWNSNTLVTASHCIADEFISKQKSCKGNIYFLFPEFKGYPFEVVGCEEIIHASPKIEGDKNSEKEPDYWMDYAFIKTSQVIPRSPMPVNRSGGLPSATPLKVYKIDPQSGEHGILGSMTLSECKVKDFDEFVPEVRAASSEYSPTVLLEGKQCEIRKGNSGATVLDESGAIRGILSGTFLARNETRGRLTKISNISCVFPDEPRCLTSLSQGRVHELLWEKSFEGIKKRISQIEKHIEGWANGHMKRFGWGQIPVSSSDHSGITIYSLPICAANARVLNQENIIGRQPWYTLFAPIYSPTAKTEVMSRAWRVKFLLADNGMPSEDVIFETTSMPIDIEYSPASMMGHPTFSSAATFSISPTFDEKAEKKLQMSGFQDCTKLSASMSTQSLYHHMLGTFLKLFEIF